MKRPEDYTWKHIEQFFLGQFEVYYNKLEWELEKSREIAYENTIRHFKGWPDWESALSEFKRVYDETPK